jgi:hypothetical protein
MCGATGAQSQLQQEDLQTLQEYNSMMQEQYANQGAIYAKVSSVLDPILEAGPGQQGFSGAEENDLNAQAVAGTAQNYNAAAKAVGEETAAEGGGNSLIGSGAAEQLKQEVANSAAQTESNEETQIQEQDYLTGRENFQTAEEGEMAIAAGENPLGYASAATNESNATANVAGEIATENNSWYSAALGAAGSIGSAVASQNPNGIFG